MGKGSNSPIVVVLTMALPTVLNIKFYQSTLFRNNLPFLQDNIIINDLTAKLLAEVKSGGTAVELACNLGYGRSMYLVAARLIL